MNITSLNDILALQESHEIEFKKAENSFPKEAWKTYSAFANTSGGYLILGVSEDNHKKPILTGVKNSDKIIDEFCSVLANRLKISLNLIENEHINVTTIENKNIIIIYIPEAPLSSKPVYLNNLISQTYLRIHSQDHLVDNHQLAAILRNQSEHLDYELLDNYSLEDLDLDSVHSYKSLLHKRTPLPNFAGMDNQHFLETIGVFRPDRKHKKQQKLTLGGLLFFGKYNAILDRVPHYHVDFFDKRGTDKRWVDRIEAGNLDLPELNLFNYYRIVMDKLILSIHRDFELDEYTVRKNPTELTEALRESLVNMIIHADYLLNTTAIIAEIHEPYYLFINPGIMKISIEEFLTAGGKSLVRNPLLVSLFTRMGAAEHAGSGSQKIIDVVVKNNFKEPELTSNLEKTTLKLWIAEPVSDTTDLNEDEKAVYAFLNQKSSTLIRFTKRSISEAFPHITPSKLARILDKLATKKLIMKHGGNKNRTYSRALSNLEMIHSVNKTFDIVKHLLYRDKSK